MGYTVIAQNNTTTTLSDDNGNVIHVPASVVLATSTSYNITKVNNNTATIEDENGKTIRNVPCVVVLAGEGGGGGSSLPDQTGHSGEFLTTDGTDASWSNTIPELDIRQGTSVYHLKIKQITGVSYGLLFCTYDNVTGQLYYDVNYHQWVVKGPYSNYFIFDEIYTCLRTSSAGGTLGNSSVKWDSIYVTKINNGSDITVPAVAGEMAVKQVNTTITLVATDWSSNTQTVNVTGMTATGVVFVSPDPTDQSAYTSAGILCTAQASGTLTFTCDTVPSGDIDVNVVML